MPVEAVEAPGALGAVEPVHTFDDLRQLRGQDVLLGPKHARAIDLCVEIQQVLHRVSDDTAVLGEKPGLGQTAAGKSLARANHQREVVTQAPREKRSVGRR